MRSTSLVLVLLASVAWNASGCKDTDPPTWPAGARVAAELEKEGVKVTVSWPEALDDEGVTGYRLVRDAHPALELTTTVHFYEGLGDAQEYTFSVFALDQVGNRSAPIEGKLTIPDLSPPAWTGVGDLSAEEVEPEGDEEIAEDGAKLRFRWDEAVDSVGVTGYRLQHDETVLAELDPETREYLHLAESLGGSYRIQARDAAGNWSTPAKADLTPLKTERRRSRMEKIVASRGLLKLLGSKGAGTGMADMFGSDPGKGLDSAIPGLSGVEVGTAGGLGARGSRGAGLGGGGTASGLGGGGMGTLGRGAAPREKVSGSVAIGEPQVEGEGLQVAAVRQAVKRRQGALRACYEKRLQQDARIAGALAFALTVADGAVTVVTVAGGQVKDEGTRKCMMRVLRRLRLPGATGKATVHLTLSKG